MGKRKKKLSKKLDFLIFSHKNYSSLVLIVVLQNVTHLNNFKFSLSYYMSFICLTCMLNFIPIRCCTVWDPWARWAFNPNPTVQTLALTLVRARGPSSLSQRPRPHAAILDLRHVGPIILAQTPRGVIRALPGQLHPRQERDCSGIPCLSCSVWPWGVSPLDILSEVGTNSNAITTTPNETPT